MLCDKSGLRKKNTIPTDPNKVGAEHKHLEGAELKNMMATFGIGTDSLHAEETDAQKADRIRKKMALTATNK